VVEYITEDGLFSIDLALRPPPGQTAQPAATVANAELDANGSSPSSNGSGGGGTRLATPSEPQYNGAEECQVRRCHLGSTAYSHRRHTSWWRICTCCTYARELHDSLCVHKATPGQLHGHMHAQDLRPRILGCQPHDPLQRLPPLASRPQRSEEAVSNAIVPPKCAGFLHRDAAVHPAAA
jgi:hypothetical protein